MPLPEVQNVSAVLVNSTSIRVMWTQISGLSGYKLVVRLLSGTLEQQVLVIGTSVTTQTVTNLTPYTNYSVQVAGVGGGGNTGPFSNSYNISTPEAGMQTVSLGWEARLFFFSYVHVHIGLCVLTLTAPGPPTDVQVIELDESLINVTWSLPAMPNGIITGMYTSTLTSWLFCNCRNYKSSDIISSHLLAKWTKIALLQAWPAGLINFTVYHSCPILYLYFYTLQATGWSLLLQMVLQCPSLWTHNSSLSCQGPKEVIVLVFRPSIVLDWGQFRMLTPHPQVSSIASCQYNHILLCLGWISSKKRITYQREERIQDST